MASFRAILVAATASRGSIKAAAKYSRIPRGHLSRLRSGQHAEIETRTWKKLQRLVGVERIGELDASIRSAAASLHTIAYQDWLNEEFDSYWPRHATRWRVRGDTIERWKQSDFVGSIVELKWLRMMFPALVQNFEHDMRARGHDEQRIFLALLRVVEPLLGGQESGFVEFSPSEIDKRTLRRFVEKGLEREEILLRRDRADRRAEQLGGLTGRALRNQANWDVMPPGSYYRSNAKNFN